MSDLSPEARQLVAAVPPGGAAAGAVLLIRHSARTPLRDASISAAYGAPLTPGGRQMACRFGEALPGDQPVRLYHSPVPRCRDTARIVRDGVAHAAGARVVGSRDWLGAPYLVDPERAVERLAGLGMAGFVAAWVRGEIRPEVAAPHAEAARALLAELLRERDAHLDALHVHVTHDLTIMMLLGLAYPVAAPDFPWPGFLEGCLLRAGSTLELDYRGEVRSIAG